MDELVQVFYLYRPEKLRGWFIYGANVLSVIGDQTATFHNEMKNQLNIFRSAISTAFTAPKPLSMITMSTNLPNLIMSLLDNFTKHLLYLLGTYKVVSELDSLA